MSGRGPNVLILYKVINHKGDEGNYNAFELPRTSSVSLQAVQDHCHALRKLNPAGAQGFHWRVRIDDKVQKGSAPKYAWWDIQDVKARLPVKEVNFTELSHILAPPKRKVLSEVDSVSKGIRSLGKAMNKVASSVEASSSSAYDSGPLVPIVMFKLVDLVQIHDKYEGTPALASQARVSAPHGAPQSARTRATAPPPQRTSARPTNTTVRPTSQAHRRPAAKPAAPKGTARRPQSATATAELMDFGSGPNPPPTRGTTAAGRVPAPPSIAPTAKPAETRAQKLKREYAQKKQTQNRVWDEVDQRWVTVDAKPGTRVQGGTTSAPPNAKGASGGAGPKPNIKAVSLDNVNTAGKSAAVAQAINARVNEMKSAQQKALQEVRQREEQKKQSESQEDEVRQRLEPKIKAWSEEHGKKKQLRALLASLHTILWPESKWKPVNLGDLLDDKKCRLAFHKASREVHPDKTMKLSPENRFLSKRIFDALSQAKSELA